MSYSFTFGQNLRQEPLCSIKFQDFSFFLFFSFWTFTVNAYFHPTYLLVLIIVSVQTHKVLSENLNFERGCPRQNLKSNYKNLKNFIVVLGNDLVWETKWYSGIVIFGIISTQTITITTRVCPRTPYNKLHSKLLVYKFCGCHNSKSHILSDKKAL